MMRNVRSYFTVVDAEQYRTIKLSNKEEKIRKVKKDKEKRAALEAKSLDIHDGYKRAIERNKSSFHCYYKSS